MRGMVDSDGRVKEKDREAIQFVKSKIDSAKWFISAIKQRHDTLMRTMQEILDYQQEYFKDGNKSKLRPMILKDIADRTGLDVSTISRVVNSKYVQTQFGIILLKSLFSEAMQTDSGEEVSSYEIKNILQQCIDEEDKRKPLTDETLMDILNSKGYRIARRTVAKYREMLEYSGGTVSVNRFNRVEDVFAFVESRFRCAASVPGAALYGVCCCCWPVRSIRFIRSRSRYTLFG